MFEMLNTAYVSSIDLVEQARMKFLIEENSIYQLALANLRERKASYLSYRNELATQDPDTVTEEMKQQLAVLEAAL